MVECLACVRKFISAINSPIGCLWHYGILIRIGIVSEHRAAGTVNICVKIAICLSILLLTNKEKCSVI